MILVFPATTVFDKRAVKTSMTAERWLSRAADKQMKWFSSLKYNFVSS